MKKDYYISALIIGFTAFVLFIVTRDFFLAFASDYKLLGGFIKFFVLASIGDFIGARFRTGTWTLPKNILYKAIVWGFIGVVIVLMFTIFTTGVAALQNTNLLPSFENEFATKLIAAFFTSLLMNVSFGSTMMAFHRMTDTYLNYKADKKDITFLGTVKTIDWDQFVRVVIFKVIPFFWIPAHTITFILPEEYRIIFAAALGIFLGLFLGAFSFKKEAASE